MYADFLKWFTGKSLENAQIALKMVEESLKEGYWIKGTSRKVHSILTKANVAQKIAREYDYALHDFFGVDDRSYGHYMYMTLMYGKDYRQFMNVTTARRSTTNEDIQRVISLYEQYIIDFSDIWAAVKQLDNTRPRPVFTTMNASPTISAELKRQGAVTVEVCPIEWEKVEDPKTGKISFWAVLVWPENTIHGSSRYTQKSMDQCHACGHAIRNPFNWVPLILTDDKGQKKSLWVGRDCSATLFGVKMEGDLELAPNQRQ